MQAQTVFRAGNSNVVALPREFDFRVGDKIVVDEVSNGEVVVRKMDRSASGLTVGENFKKWWDIFIKENGEILDELAVR